MNIAEKMVSLLGPLCEGRVYFDETPPNGPEGYPYIVIEHASGKAQWFVEQKMRDAQHYRFAITGVTQKPGDRADFALLIEKTICEADFPASEPYGSWISGRSDTHKELYSQQQFGVYFVPVTP